MVYVFAIIDCPNQCCADYPIKVVKLLTTDLKKEKKSTQRPKACLLLNDNVQSLGMFHCHGLPQVGGITVLLKVM